MVVVIKSIDNVKAIIRSLLHQIKYRRALGYESFLVIFTIEKCIEFVAIVIIACIITRRAKIYAEIESN